MAILGIIICAGLVLVFRMIFLAHHDRLLYHHVTDKQIPDQFTNFRIFFISDIHRRRINKKTIEKIKEPIDIIIIGGDITEKFVPLQRTIKNIRRLKKWQQPIYFIWGNNDYEAQPDRLARMLRQENVIILTNSNDTIIRGNRTISILGLDCFTYGEPRLDLAMQGAQGSFMILLTHDPEAFYLLSDQELQSIDIALAGHTHGGQIRIMGVGPYERGGLDKYKNTKILISEGYGYSSLPFRLGTNSQCHVITFEKLT